MKVTAPIQIHAKNRKVFLALAIAVLLFVIFTILQDALRSEIKNSAFYFSESLLFSSFWWLFAPLLFGQYYLVNQNRSKAVIFQLALMLLPAVIHLFAFPLAVWALSALFYYHTYAIQQTLRYALAEHVYDITVLYTIPVVLYQFVFKRTEAKFLPLLQQPNPVYIKSIVITEGNKRIPVAMAEVCYFSARPPYIGIHINGKKYLLQETLKSISGKLDPAQFIRIHRSAIVNINMVVLYSTRLNGDYDLTLKNNVQLRVSRNYAADFKKLFHKTHPLTTK